MRYEDWDILLFPRDSKTPLKEFKVACHVVHDNEFSYTSGSFGVPMVCCFVPSLPPGSPFQISIHSWVSKPPLSQFTRSYTKFPADVNFEARLLIDGRLVASTSFHPADKWPHLIANSFEFSKNGDLEFLKFPTFKQELLQQTFWNPADDLGRIKIVISEGFPRDSLSMPIERVKNVVAFSFQHAPLEILESSGIAWPNPAMWHRTPYATSMPVPSFQTEEGESHAHSPRRRKSGQMNKRTMLCSQNTQPSSVNAVAGSETTLGVPRNVGGVFHSSNNFDPFEDSNAYFEWLGGMNASIENSSDDQRIWRQVRNTRKGATDISMPDYTPSGQSEDAAGAPIASMAPILSNKGDDDSILAQLIAPSNTPTTMGQEAQNFDGASFSHYQSNIMPVELATSLTNSLLNQPPPANSIFRGSLKGASDVRSRKENLVHENSLPPHLVSRKVSRQLSNPADAEMSLISPHVRSLLDTRNRQVSRQSSNCADAAVLAGDSSQGAMEVTQASPTAADGKLQDIKGCPDHPCETTNLASLDKSAKAIDGEDEPRRSSPRLGLTTLTTEGVSN